MTASYPLSVVLDERGSSRDDRERSLRSLARQTIGGWQLVVLGRAVGQAGEGAWADLVASARPDEIDLVGPERTVEEGLSIARRKYVCLLVAGSLLSASALESGTWALETRPHSDAARVGSGAIVFRREAWIRRDGLRRLVAASGSEMGSAPETMSAHGHDQRFGRKSVTKRFAERLEAKLRMDELTDPRWVITHPTDTLLRLVPTRLKRERWARWGLPMRPDPWSDIPVLVPRPDGWSIPSARRVTPDHPRRVLILHSHLQRGGAETVLLNLVRAADRASLRFTIVTTDDPDGGQARNPLRTTFEDEVDGVFDLPGLLERRWHLRFVVDLIESLRAEVLLISLSRFAYNAAATIRRELPYLAIIDLLHAEAPYAPIDHITLAASHRDSLDHRVVVTEELKKAQIEKFDEEPERITVIRNGVDTGGMFDPERYLRGTVRDRLGIGDANVILWFGRFAEEKQPLHLVEVADRLRNRRDIQFILVGSGPLRGRVDEEISRRGLTNVVVQEGTDRIAEYLRDADLTMFPSQREGSPLSGIESLAMATPIVASRVPGWTGLVEDGVTGILVDDGDFDGYARHVTALLDDRSTLSRMAAAARRAAEDRYSLATFGDEWTRFLRRIGTDGGG